MRSSVEHRVCYAALALKFLVVLLFVIVASAVADIHPVPLEKNADSAKCLECHNSDDNREFGGTGPNGPHGSKFTHILERRYEFSQAAVPGQLISNLFPSPDLTVNGPYALCGKCHDLSQVMSNTSFSDHARHLNDGFSCSACHTAHGMGGVSATISGQRLVNFDIKVVAPNGVQPISYNRGTNSCTLTCHNHAHGAAAASNAIRK